MTGHQAILITEILELILLQVPFLEVITSCRAVCRSWGALIKTSPRLRHYTKTGHDLYFRAPYEITPRASFTPATISLIKLFWKRLTRYSLEELQERKNYRRILLNHMIELYQELNRTCGDAPLVLSPPNCEQTLTVHGESRDSWEGVGFWWGSEWPEDMELICPPDELDVVGTLALRLCHNAYRQYLSSLEPSYLDARRFGTFFEIFVTRKPAGDVGPPNQKIRPAGKWRIVFEADIERPLHIGLTGRCKGNLKGALILKSLASRCLALKLCFTTTEHRVFVIPELLEAIILRGPVDDIISTCKAVSKRWRDLINTSPHIRHYTKTGLLPTEENEVEKADKMLNMDYLTYGGESQEGAILQKLLSIFKRFDEATLTIVVVLPPSPEHDLIATIPFLTRYLANICGFVQGY
ncbi:hypothetical protein H072_6727 [Dactylellina haptotyla CBS 200.50]|uniref:F-box domain-containing protein n=1 Tax=Dactylellina haptotyla (strain CBS 200.50) TaxID=1284197 RepID=S8AEH7_DACHA|nr:hypothetical protein H072_6727 [Dactylellina haptotyla CBS 200.50]